MERNFDIDAGDGDGGVSKVKNISKTIVRTKIVHTSGQFSKNGKNSFKIYSYIQKMTTDTIHAIKLPIYKTKHTNNTKTHFKRSKCLEHFVNSYVQKM